MATKTPLTPDEHEGLGARLAGIRDQLLADLVRIENAYARTGADGAAARDLRAALKKIDSARSELENRFYREHPLSARPEAYYPGPGAAAVVCRNDLQHWIMANLGAEAVS